MIVSTTRFGRLTVKDEDIISVPQGLIGLAEMKRFVLVDAGDETLILWMQSVDRPDLCIAVLEPKIFKPDYVVRLSAAELRELQLESLSDAAVYSVLTIPEEVSEMSANLKAPIVINLKRKLARQVVLQENDYNVKHLMFKELRAHLLTIEAQKGQTVTVERGSEALAISVGEIPRSQSVRSLQLG